MADSRRVIPATNSRRNDVHVSSALIARKWYSTAEVAEMLGFGLSKTKFLVLSGEIRSLKVGRHRKVLPEWVDEYICHQVTGEVT
jgi:excisionase family DNA binding protein